MNRPAGSLRQRYRRIVFFFSRVVLSLIWWEIILRRVRGRDYVGRTSVARYRHLARQFRHLAVDLGGVMIKLGQFIGSRMDVMPPEVIEELAGLQDEVPPVDFAEIQAVVEAELSGPLGSKFACFDSTSRAAASLGQVHKAILPGDEKVAIKVQRPRIEELVRVDLSAIHVVVRWVRSYPPIRKRADLEALFEEFQDTLFEELDYLSEGRNAERFAANFAADAGVLIPRPYWSHTTRRVLALQDVEFIKITDFARLAEAHIDRHEVALRLMNAYLQQVFVDGFFHADPHPGNLFIKPVDATDGTAGQAFQLVFVDFGMVGRITAANRQHLRSIAIAIGTRDPDRLVAAFHDLGFLLPSADLALIERATAAVFDRFWGMSVGQLSQITLGDFRPFLREFRSLLLTLPFQIPQDFIYLGRALGMLNGLATSLDPTFNVFESVQPFAEQLLLEETQSVARGPWWEGAAEWGRSMAALPSRADRFLNRALSGDLEVRAAPSRDLARAMSRLAGAVNRLAWMVAFAGLLIAAVLSSTAGQSTLSAVCLVLAVLSMLLSLRSGRDS